MTIASKHLQKLTLPNPALKNTTNINLWKNQRKSTWLVLSGATEVRQQPPIPVLSEIYRGAPNCRNEFWKWIVDVKTWPQIQKEESDLAIKPHSKVQLLCAANRKVGDLIFHPKIPVLNWLWEFDEQSIVTNPLQNAKRWNTCSATTEVWKRGRRFGNSSPHSKGSLARETRNNTFVKLPRISTTFSPGKMRRSVAKKPNYTMLLPNGPSSPAACCNVSVFACDLE